MRDRPGTHTLVGWFTPGPERVCRMRLAVPRETSICILRWTQRALFTAAVSMLAYCGLVLTDAWVSQARERRHFDRLVAGRQAQTGRGPETSSATGPFRGTAAAGDLLGRMEIPRLKLSVMIMEGTSTTTLRRGVGHIPGTTLPGEAGNVGLSGHRDTFFRPLRNIQPNDIIALTTLRGEYRYRVASTKVVDPQNVGVLSSSGKQILTLVTCYPFHFVGPAADRFIVRAERIEDGP